VLAAVIVGGAVAVFALLSTADLFRKGSLGAVLSASSPETAEIHARVAAGKLALSTPQGAVRVTRYVTAAPRPGVITYEVRSGGTLRDISRIYGMPLDDIEALNPRIGPETFLEPKSRVVVYEQGRALAVGVKVGSVDELYGGVPLSDGPGRRIRRRSTSWGRGHTVANLDAALRTYGSAYPEGPVVIVSDLSRRTGGRLSPHHTHRDGRDVDLSYVPRPEIDNGGFMLMSRRLFDVERNWTFVDALVGTGEVEVILMDTQLQKLLYEQAASKGVAPERLSEIFQYPRDPSSSAGVIRHWDGHRDHMHVRFSCPPEDLSCGR
jgi:hypothetical protein